MSSPHSTHPMGAKVRRRGLATVATLAGVGASLSLVALSPTTALTSTAIVPAAGAPASAGGTAAPRRAVAAPAAPAGLTAFTPAAKGAPVGRSAPAAKAAPTHEMAASSATACGGLQSAVDAFLMHFNAAHLETSPGQQVADALSIDQYTKTHTVLIESMLTPLLGGAQGGLDAFLQHVYAAHLEASPGQQVADIADIDQYVKTHTVMVENMVKPLGSADVSAC